MFNFPTFPLDAFFADEQQVGDLGPNQTMLPTLYGANLVFGREVTSGDQFLVFGRELLHSIVRTGIAQLTGLIIEIDQGKDSKALESSSS